MTQEFRSALKKAAEKYADANPGILLDNDGSVYDDYDKPFRDFMEGALWVLTNEML